MVLCFPHVRGPWRAGDARGWAPALTSCACRPGVGPPDDGAAGPGPLSEAPCDLGVRTLHSPQASSTRPSVTSRHASVTGVWLCASRSRYTGRSTATTSTSTARAPRSAAASTSRPPHLPRSPGGWRRGREEALALGARWMEQADVGVDREPRGASGHLPPGALQRDWPQRNRKGLGPGPGHQAPPAQPWMWLCPGHGRGHMPCWGLSQAWKRLGASKRGLSLTEPGTKGWIPGSSRPRPAAASTGPELAVS